jgi:acetyl esterase/lipase
MRLWTAALLTVALSIILLLSLPCNHQPDSGSWSAYVANRYRIVPNIPYSSAHTGDRKLDVYLPTRLAGPHPTLIYIHGGGWVGGSKEASVLFLLPYLEMGWAVVNVEYRLGHVALAPAAVEDCRCALRWVIRNAEQYNFDTSRLVMTGHSAGGHLALTNGMLPASAGFDRQCPGTEELKVAAIINWYGITDVADLLDGANRKDYAVAWLGNQAHRDEIAQRLSPVSYVRPGLPPILTIHGDADPVVPYSHALKLHEALAEMGVPHQLVTIAGATHGEFNRAQLLNIYATIQEFLIQHHVSRRSSSATNPARKWLSDTHRSIAVRMQRLCRFL